MLEGEIVVVVGNGSSLLNVPRDWVESYPTFGVNFVYWWASFNHRRIPLEHEWWGFCPDYWCCLDAQTIEAIETLPRNVVKFMPPRRRADCKDFKVNEDEIVFGFVPDLIKGLSYGNEGTIYSTTLLYAGHLADYLGAPTILLVGFDCTEPINGLVRDQRGLTGAPHFYDPEPEQPFKRMEIWDRQFGAFAKYLEGRGKRVINLSKPTMATRVPVGDWTEWVQ